jgi:hypothetical protein
MPLLPGQELGEEPPPAPRRLPKGFAFRTRFSSNFAVIAGTAFLFVGSLIFAGLLKAKTFAALVPLFFMVGGFFLFRHGWMYASKILRAFRKGVAVRGEVYECRIDKTQSLNGENPYKLTWHFTVEGRQYEGSLTSFDSTLGSRGRGQSVWVLYVRRDPEQNTLYPPVR